MENRQKTKVLILAAGKGKRMQDDIPKVLIQIQGEPMIKHLLRSVQTSGIDEKPVIVVGYGKEDVMQTLGKDYEYVTQEKQLGTGHAVMAARKALENKADHLVVLYGDHPFITPSTIKALVAKHLNSKDKITMATVRLPDFDEWRDVFHKNFSRVIRDENKNIIKDVQYKDATDEEKEITEVNPCYFCFETSWLWKNLETLKNDNTQKEYYLTDLVKIAIEKGEKIGSIEISPREALGANSKEELVTLEKLHQ